jgi:hypothetical protein
MRNTSSAIVAATLTGSGWVRRTILSTARPAIQVFAVDMIAAFMASFMLSTAFGYVQHNSFTFAFTSLWFSIAAFMAVMAGLIGFNGARGLRRDTEKMQRSATRTVAWTLGAPVAATLSLASMVETQGDWTGMFIVFMMFGPALSVFGYRYMGFKPVAVATEPAMAA